MNIRYHVDLTEAERGELAVLTGGGEYSVRRIKRAQILLAAEGGLGDDAIAAAVAVGGSTVYRTKRRFVEGGLHAALNEEPRAAADRKLTGNEEALLVATACSSPPEGRARWTLELLAGEMVSLTGHDGLSRETVRRPPAENDLKPWQKDMWCIPGRCRLRRPHGGCARSLCRQPDPKRPVICFDESPTELIGEAREPISPGPARLDVSTTPIAATAWSISSSSLMPIALGGTSSSRVIGPPTTSPFACATSSISTAQKPSASASLSTISPPTPPPLFMPPSRRPKPVACSRGSSSITRPSTPAGSTWLRSRSASSNANAWTAASNSVRLVAEIAAGSRSAIAAVPNQLDVLNRES